MRHLDNVLLVDDDPLFNKMNEKIILMSECPMKVNSYLDPQKALKHLKQVIRTNLDKFPEAIFLDINMPVMDGWQFLKELERFPPIIVKMCRVFMLSSSIDRKDIEKSMSYGMVYDFIPKPLTVDKVKMVFSLNSVSGYS